MDVIVDFQLVTKEYGTRENCTLALNEASFQIRQGEFVVILGPSGAGKSTILNLLGGMDSPTSGEILIEGKNIVDFSENQLADYRGKHIGFVFQFYNLIPTLTVQENVALMKELNKDSMPSESALAMVGLQDHLHKFPSQLSGGEQQRVSIARAICKNPTLMLCDEPTGALDSQTGMLVLTQLQELCRSQGQTTIIVTHNAAISKAADRVIYVKNGRIEQVVEQAEPCAISEVVW